MLARQHAGDPEDEQGAAGDGERPEPCAECVRRSEHEWDGDDRRDVGDRRPGHREQCLVGAHARLLERRQHDRGRTGREQDRPHGRMPEVEHARDRDPTRGGEHSAREHRNARLSDGPEQPLRPQRDVHPGAEHEHRKPDVAEKRDRRIL